MYNLRTMNWPLVMNATKGIWTVIGPLIGVFVGAYIANRNDRKHWIADRKREEYQKLLSALTEAFGELLQLQNKGVLTMDEFNKVQVQVYNAINNCIFTSDAVITQLDIFKGWAKASTKLKDGGKAEFSDSTPLLLEDIRQMTIKDINS